ncbi:MAG: hypothetical protein ICV80_14940 [Microcoleus sp. T1-bin1]|nr:hypothetical protein [Microcoleus sp. T1-bin1]
MPKPKRSWRYLQSDLPDCLRFARSRRTAIQASTRRVRTYALSLEN